MLDHQSGPVLPEARSALARWGDGRLRSRHCRRRRHSLDVVVCPVDRGCPHGRGQARRIGEAHLDLGFFRECSCSVEDSGCEDDLVTRRIRKPQLEETQTLRRPLNAVRVLSEAQFRGLPIGELERCRGRALVEQKNTPAAVGHRCPGHDAFGANGLRKWCPPRRDCCLSRTGRQHEQKSEDRKQAARLQTSTCQRRLQAVRVPEPFIVLWDAPDHAVYHCRAHAGNVEPETGRCAESIRARARARDRVDCCMSPDFRSLATVNGKEAPGLDADVSLAAYSLEASSLTMPSRSSTRIACVFR